MARSKRHRFQPKKQPIPLKGIQLRVSSKKKKSIKRKLFQEELLKPCCFCFTLMNFETATIEHIIPLSNGGNWKIENLDVSCSQCNNDRGSKPYSYFRVQRWNQLNKHLNCIGSI